jgi:hypothetical protein
MREFRNRSESWRVWSVSPQSEQGHQLAEEHREGWLCFEDVDSGRRWRLSVSQAPTDWDTLSDIRLRQLLSMARKGAPGTVTTKAASEQRRRIEDAARKTT